jgi:hypothetical protein
MPSNVTWFERLMYGALLLSLVSGYLVAQGELTAAADDIGLGRDALLGVVVGIVIIFAAIWVLFIWLAARRHKGWARYVLAILFVLSLLAYLQGYAEIAERPVEGLVNGVQLVMQLVALILVFTGNAREWFTRPAPQT